MARVKRGNVLKNRHRKILKFAKGFRGSKSTLFIAANQAVIQAWRNMYRDRRKRKRDFRRLWITRINAACRAHVLPRESSQSRKEIDTWVGCKENVHSLPVEPVESDWKQLDIFCMKVLASR